MIDKTPYTPGMREVLKLSKAEAGRLGHDYIGPEHYLLGVIRKGDGLAVQTLMNLDVDLEDVKMELERMVEVGKASDGRSVSHPTPMPNASWRPPNRSPAK